MSQKNLPLISIVLVVKDDEKHIGYALDSIFSQNLDNSMYEVIVVDGGSRDNTQNIVKKYKSVNLIIDKGGTIGHSRQIGVNISKATKYVAFVDSDVEVTNNWLNILMQEIKNSDSDVVAVGGPTLPSHRDNYIGRMIAVAQMTFLGSGGSPQAYYIKRKMKVKQLSNCSVIFKKDILKEVSYNISLNMGEDADLWYRLNNKGYKGLYVPTAVAYHSRPNSLKIFAKKMYRYGKGMAKLFKIHSKIIRWYAAIPTLAIIFYLLFATYFAYLSKWNFVICPLLIGYLFLEVYATMVSLNKQFQGYNIGKEQIIFLMPIIFIIQYIFYGLGFLRGLF